jgi:hypothetical protein
MDDSEKDKKQTAWVIDCYKCGTQNAFGLRYCTVCGEKFIYKCPQCNADIDPDYQVCPYCTVSIDWGYIPENASPLPGIEAKELDEELESKGKEKTRESRTGLKRISSPSRKRIWLIAFVIVIVCIAIVFAIDMFL